MRWWKNGVLVAESDKKNLENNSMGRLKMWSNSSLEVLNVEAEDSGEYMCKAFRAEPWGQVTQIYEIEVTCEYVHTVIQHAHKYTHRCMEKRKVITRERRYT